MRRPCEDAERGKESVERPMILSALSTLIPLPETHDWLEEDQEDQEDQEYHKYQKYHKIVLWLWWWFELRHEHVL